MLRYINAIKNAAKTYVIAALTLLI